MRTSILVGSFLAASALMPGTARAQAQDFGNKGQLAILNDSNLQLTGTSESNNGGSSFTFSVLPSVEYFVIDNLSLGGFVEYAHTSISPAGNGPSTNTDTFGVGPRVGYDFRLSNSFSFWPKAFIAFATTNESSGNQSGSNTSWTLGIFAPFLLHPAEHFFLGLGPLLSTQIANSNSPGGGQPQATVYGLEFELGGWVGL
jgi:hypothetical protein